jgi:hypothetical protein
MAAEVMLFAMMMMMMPLMMPFIQGILFSMHLLNARDSGSSYAPRCNPALRVTLW